jgi:hypothetical protein
LCCCCFPQCKIIVFVLYKMAFHFLIFNLERHQRELFSPDSFNGSVPPMEVIKLQNPTKISLWRSDDGLIPEKSKAEVYYDETPLECTAVCSTLREELWRVRLWRGSLRPVGCWDADLMNLPGEVAWVQPHSDSWRQSSKTLEENNRNNTTFWTTLTNPNSDQLTFSKYSPTVNNQLASSP